MTRIRVSYIKAPLIAAFLAFPFFAGMAFFVSIVERLPKPIEISQPGETFIELLAIFFGSLVFGWIIAVIPCAIGTAILANLGKAYPAMRFTLFWVFVGTAVIAIPTAIAQGFTGDAAAPLIALTLTGGFCAAVCRRFTTWTEAPLEQPDLAPARAVSPPRPVQ